MQPIPTKGMWDAWHGLLRKRDEICQQFVRDAFMLEYGLRKTMRTSLCNPGLYCRFKAQDYIIDQRK